MGQASENEHGRNLIEDLRKIAVFSGLPEEHLAWLAEKFEEVHLQPGEVFLREGDPAERLVVILEGEIRFQRSDIPDGPAFRASAGQVTGLLPYSRLTHYRGTGRALGPARLALLHKSLFPEMLQRMPELGQRLVALMSDRIRESARLETQRDKLAALGKLSAGLAHELNNPAAAAQRATASLRETLETVRDASIRLARHALTAEQRDMRSNATW
jgi:CRP-like cAMP-binding protein